jgi:hypothetical protein
MVRCDVKGTHTSLRGMASPNSMTELKIDCFGSRNVYYSRSFIDSFAELPSSQLTILRNESISGAVSQKFGGGQSLWQRLFGAAANIGTPTWLAETHQRSARFIERIVDDRNHRPEPRRRRPHGRRLSLSARTPFPLDQGAARSTDDGQFPLSLVQPSHRRETPVPGMPLLKKLLDLFFASISSKSDLNAMVIRYFLRRDCITDEK